MNYRTQLINMVNEARNLPASELDLVPGTSIYVKKGRVKEFESNAYFYCKEINNDMVDEASYLEDVYKAIERAISLEAEEYYNAKATEIALANKDNVDKLDNLNASLINISANYEKLSKQFMELQNKAGSLDKDRFNKVTDDLKKYAENRDHLYNKIIEIKNDVNANFVSAIKEQMEDIRNTFLTSPRGTEIGYGTNGLSILASDKPEYDSLIALLRLMNEVNNDEKIVAVNGVMCVNESQVGKAKELLGKTKAFGIVAQNKVKVANDKLISEIVAELRRIEGESEKAYQNLKDPKFIAQEADNGKLILNGEFDNYNNLIKILRYLNSANAVSDRNYSVVPVWGGLAYIQSGVEESVFLSLMRKTKPINKYDPKIKQIEKNNKLIAELEEYLRKMENDYNTYNGVTNIPTAITSNNTIVLEGAAEEYEYIYDIINILKDTENKELQDVFGIAFVSSENISRFKYLLGRTKKFSDAIPVPEENKTEIEKIKARLTELNNIAKEKAQADPNVKLAPNGVVLDSDLPEYEALVEKLGCLENSKGSSKLVPVNGAMIDKDLADKYAEADKTLTDINKPSLDSLKIEDYKNEEKLAEINKRIEELQGLAQEAESTEAIYISGIKVLNSDKDELITLITIRDCLENAKISDNLEIVGDVLLDISSKPAYLWALNNLKEIQKEKSSQNKGQTSQTDNLNIDDYKNEERLAEINQRIEELEGLTSDEAKEELDVLLVVKNCLENAKVSNNLEKIEDENILVDANDKDKYLEALEKLKAIRNNSAGRSNINEGKWANINVDIAKLNAKGKKAPLGIKPEESVIIDGIQVLNKDSEELKALLTIKRCLENAKTSSDLVEFDGVSVDKGDYPEYIEAIAILDKVRNSIAEHNKSLEGLADEVRNKKGKNPESKRKKVSVRKLNKKLPKVTLKRVALVGLGIAAMAPGLTALAPALVYASSSLGLGTVAELIATVASNVTVNNGIGYVTVVPIDATIAKVSAAVGTVASLSTLGVIALTAKGVSKWKKDKNKEETEEETKEKVKVIDKLKGLGKSIGKVKLPGSSLINSAKEGRRKAKEEAEEKRKNKEKKNIQEQIAEEVAAEQQSKIDVDKIMDEYHAEIEKEQQALGDGKQLGSENKPKDEILGGPADSTQTNNEEDLKNLKKKLHDLIFKQANLEESSPDYQNLQNEIDAVVAQISNYGEDASKLLDSINDEIEKAGTHTLASSAGAESETQEKPVVVVPPAQDILNNLSGSESETEKLINWYNGCLEELNSSYNSPEDKQIARQNLEEAKRRLKELGVEIPGEKSKEPIFGFTNEEQAKLDRWNIPNIDALIFDYEDAINKGGDVSKARENILYSCGIYIDASVNSTTFEVDYEKFGDRLEYVLNLSDEDFMKHFESEIRKNNDLLRKPQSPEVTNRINRDNEILMARVESLRKNLNIVTVEPAGEPTIPVAESSTTGGKERLIAEQAELQRKIDAISDPNDLDRIAYEQRLQEIGEEISSFGEPEIDSTQNLEEIKDEYTKCINSLDSMPNITDWKSIIKCLRRIDLLYTILESEGEELSNYRDILVLYRAYEKLNLAYNFEAESLIDAALQKRGASLQKMKNIVNEKCTQLMNIAFDASNYELSVIDLSHLFYDFHGIVIVLNNYGYNIDPNSGYLNNFVKACNKIFSILETNELSESERNDLIEKINLYLSELDYLKYNPEKLRELQEKANNLGGGRK